MINITKPADLAVGDVIQVFGQSHVIAAVRWEGGNIVWTSAHAIGWNGKPAESALVPSLTIAAQRAA